MRLHYFGFRLSPRAGLIFANHAALCGRRPCWSSDVARRESQIDFVARRERPRAAHLRSWQGLAEKSLGAIGHYSEIWPPGRRAQDLKMTDSRVVASN